MAMPSTHSENRSLLLESASIFLHSLSPHQEDFPKASHLANSSSAFQVHLLKEPLSGPWGSWPPHPLCYGTYKAIKGFCDGSRRKEFAPAKQET